MLPFYACVSVEVHNEALCCMCVGYVDHMYKSSSVSTEHPPHTCVMEFRTGVYACVKCANII